MPRTKKTSNLPFFVSDYFNLMDKYPQRFCKDQWALREMIERIFKKEKLVVDYEQCENYFSLIRYMPFDELYIWQKFIFGLHLCTYKQNGTPRFPDLFAMIGRGAGKDGSISFEAMCLISPYNPIKEYDVDICANNEDQAKRPVRDLIQSFDNHRKKLLRFFYWTQEMIKGKSRNSYIKGHTNNAKGKDGLRSGCVIFNEYHAYENYDNINVFTTGLGKKAHPRRSIWTTNGDVVDGPLDETIKDCEEILFNNENDNGMLPFICRLDSKDEVDDEENWYKANPSLMYNETLLNEIRKEYREWKRNPARLPAFMTKRMNVRDSIKESQVTSWDNIIATNRPIPELKGDCVVGIDYSKTNDWVAVNIHFKKGEQRYDINHAWICMQGTDVGFLRCPYKDWAEKGLLTLVYEPEISPQVVINYLLNIPYHIVCIGMDSYRYTLFSDYLQKIGFSVENKSLKLIRPSDIMKIYPTIDRCFSNKFFAWGDNPVLRWATNNTKLVRATRSAIAGDVDTGNFLFGKIEPQTRKTDPFMALVHSMCVEDKLIQRYVSKRKPIVKVY